MRTMLGVAALVLLAACDKDDGTAGWVIAGSSATSDSTGASADAGGGDTGSVVAADTAAGDAGGAATGGDVAGAGADASDTAASGVADAQPTDAGGDAVMDARTDASGAADATPGDGAAADAGATDTAAPACTPVIAFAASTTAQHVTEPPSYPAYPPSSGDHYAVWSKWGVAEGIVPTANWVHNLEHGGVALLYRCDPPCTEDVAAMVGLIEQLPGDAACDDVTDVDHRVVVTEDPCLPDGVRFAAIAWEWTYTASCLDTTSMLQFMIDHGGQAPEDECTEGGFVAEPGVGVTCPTIAP